MMARNIPRSVRDLPPIPSDPTPTKREIAAELRKQNNSLKSLPRALRMRFAELYWYAAAREKHPDLFWRPFSPDEYGTYLKSDQWKRISREVKQAAGNKCACCPNEAKAVHHRCYRPRVMSGDDRSLLIALCHDCHRTVDFDENGKVRSNREKERVLAELFARESKRLAGDI
jgi:hypothetical protein